MDELRKSGVHISMRPDLARPASLTALGRSSILMPRGSVENLITFGPFSAFQMRGELKSRSGRIFSLVEGMGHHRVGGWKERLGAIALNRYADRVGALCDAEVDRLVAAGVNASLIEVVYNPIDTDFVEEIRLGAEQLGRRKILHRHGIPIPKVVVACFASLQKRKRHDLLLQGFSRLTADRDDLHLVLVGDGPERPAIKRKIARLDLQGNVSLLNRLAYSDAIALMTAVDYVVHASDQETFGYAMVEPLLVGKRLLATRTGIGFEIDRNEIGIFVETGDSYEFELGLRRLLSCGSLSQSDTERAKNFVVSHFSLDSFGERLLAAIAIN